MNIPSAETRVWDEKLAMANVDGNVQDLKELLEIWLRQTPCLLFDIRTALENNDHGSLHLAAHTLKGSLQILGIEAAVSISQALENAGRTELTSDGMNLLIQLESELNLVTPQILFFLNEH